MLARATALIRGRWFSGATDIFGTVESANAGEMSGWVAGAKTRGAPIAIRIKVGDRLIQEGRANKPRPDIDRVYGLTGAMEFRVPVDKSMLEHHSEVELWARRDSGGRWIRTYLPREVFRADCQKPSRSGFDPSLRALRLDLIWERDCPDNVLDGLSVLDIGCNERELYRKASGLGARLVVGLDVLNSVGQLEIPSTRITRGGLWDIPNQIFDVIFLSVLDLEPLPKRYLRKLRDHLAPHGVLILECIVGRSGGPHATAWTTVQVDGSLRRYPSSQVLRDDLLEDFAIRPISTDEGAIGSCTRQIFLCRPFRPIVVLISAIGGTGKSVIAQTLKAKGFRTFSLDMLIRRLVQSDDYNWSSLNAPLRPFRDAPTLARLDQIGRVIAGERLADEFADVVLQDISLETSLLFIEGEILIHKSVQIALERKLRERGSLVWNMTPSSTKAL